MTATNFITRFDTTLTKYTDINIYFRIAGGYSLIAQTLGRHFVLDDLGLRPNMFFMVSSPPRMGRRGDLLKYISYAKNSCFSILHKNNKKKFEREIQAHMLDGGSPQGLIDDINKFRDYTSGSVCITSPEFGKRLSAILSNKGYTSNMDSLLCKAYTGEADYESFSERQGDARFLKEGYYLNIFGTLQKINKYITTEHFSEIGLGRRFSIFSVDGEFLLKNPHKPLLGRNVNELKNELQKLGRDIGKEMIRVEKLSMNSLITITYNNDVKKYINNLDKKYDMLAKQNDDNAYYLFLQGKIDQLLKFAMNKCIAEKKTALTMDIIKLAEKISGLGTEKLQDILEQTMMSENRRQKEKYLRKMMELIAKGKTHSERLKYFTKIYGIHAKEMNEIYLQLKADGKIDLKERSKGIYDYEVRY